MPIPFQFAGSMCAAMSLNICNGTTATRMSCKSLNPRGDPWVCANMGCVFKEMLWGGNIGYSWCEFEGSDVCTPDSCCGSSYQRASSIGNVGAMYKQWRAEHDTDQYRSLWQLAIESLSWSFAASFNSTRQNWLSALNRTYDKSAEWEAYAVRNFMF